MHKTLFCAVNSYPHKNFFQYIFFLSIFLLSCLGSFSSSLRILFTIYYLLQCRLLMKIFINFYLLKISLYHTSSLKDISSRHRILCWQSFSLNSFIIVFWLLSFLLRSQSTIGFKVWGQGGVAFGFQQCDYDVCSGWEVVGLVCLVFVSILLGTC